MGLLAGINAARLALAQPLLTPPRETALGALIAHLTNTATKDFQPMNVNFGLFSPLDGRIPKKLRGAAYAARALQELEEWLARGEPGLTRLRDTACRWRITYGILVLYLRVSD